MDPPNSQKTIGQVAYEAHWDAERRHQYLLQAEQTQPDWPNISSENRNGWEAAAARVRAETIEDCAKICNQMAHKKRELLFKVPHDKVSSLALDMVQAALDNAGVAIRALKRGGAP